MTEETPAKRGRGRPKLEAGQKGSYNVSRAEKARRQSQRSLAAAKKRRASAERKVQKSREAVKKKETNLQRIMRENKEAMAKKGGKSGLLKTS